MVTGASKIWVGVDDTPVELKKSDSSDVVTGEITLGNTILLDDKSWIVCHVDTDNNCAYLAYPTVVSMVYYNSDRSILYAGSLLASIATDFQNSMSDAALSRMIDVTESEVTAKIFVPDGLNKYDYFMPFSGTGLYGVRLCYYNGRRVSYWLSASSSVGSIPYMYEDGYYSTASYGNTTKYGFRPFCCISL